MSRPVILFLFCMAAWLVGCSGNGAQVTPYRPPTAAAPLLPAVPTPTAALPTATLAPPACDDGLTFQEDLTVPDGTVVRPGDVLDKRWEVTNSGTCNWDERYRLRLMDGPEMGAMPEQALYPARGGVEGVIIRVVFTAPVEPGHYLSAWQAVNPQDETFGDLIYMEIVVEEP